MMTDLIESRQERLRRTASSRATSKQYSAGHVGALVMNRREAYAGLGEIIPASVREFGFKMSEVALLGGVVMKGAISNDPFIVYDVLRSKAKSDERARYEFLCEQIHEKLSNLEWGECRILPNYVVLPDGALHVPKKYFPSDELINIVRNSILRKQDELASISEDGRVLPDEESFPLSFIYENSRTTASDDVIRDFVSKSVRGFLATIGQGLAYGDGELAVLSKNGELLDVVLAGFRTRIPVMLKDAGHFSTLLYKDLVRASYSNLLNSEFGELVAQDNALVVRRIKTVTPASERGRRQGRAEMTRLG